MKINMVGGELNQLDQHCLVAFATNDGTVLNGTAAIAGHVETFLPELGKKGGAMLYLPNPAGLASKRLLLYNLGEKIEKDDDLRKAAALAWKDLRKRDLTTLAVSIAGLDDAQARALLEGFFLGAYQYTDLKTDKEKLPVALEEITVHDDQGRGEAVNRWYSICQGTNRARDLCQMPANILTPDRMAELAKEWGTAFGFNTRVLGQEELEKEEMRTMLSVSQGSEQPPRLMVMEYDPGNARKTYAFVGKAVTFDSGGLSLKPSNAMVEMKGDMGGGAAVLGLMTALREAKCPHRVVGIVPAVENMPSGTATRPSDVVKSKSGVTVEINNTDAEGRLILADALTYAARFNPDYVVDFATLTGACLVALGPKVCGVMGNYQPLVDAVIKGGNQVHEPFWQLPLFDEYKELLKSDVADISNIGSVRWGGTITAGLFLERFARDYRWAHCDIAAAIFEKGADYQPSGGTGIGVRMALAMMDIDLPAD